MLLVIPFNRTKCFIATAFFVALAAQTTSGAVPYVVHMSLDGLGAVYLQPYVTAAPGQFPNFVRLQTQGAFTYNARCDFGASETIPNHTSMFTGRPALRPAGFPNTTHHGYIINAPPESDTYHNAGNLNVPYKASVFDVVHDHGLSTGFYAGKSKLNICDRSFDAVNGAIDLIGVDNGRDKIDFAFVGDYSAYYGTPFTNQVNALITNLMSGVPKDYSFIHIAEPDLTGHTGGWNDANGNYSNMVRMVDVQVGRVFAAIESNPVLSNRTTLIVTTDHGGGGIFFNGHSEPEFLPNYTIPFFVWGPGVPAGVNLYSLMPNRGDPGTNRTDYNTVPQPIRNGDSGNLVLSLLGLPPIPGSLMQPFFAPAGVSLTVNESGSGAVLSWPSAALNFVLEATPNLAPPVQWQPITNGIVEIGALKTLPIETFAGAQLYYRLRKP
jgi:hypothetical protein